MQVPHISSTSGSDWRLVGFGVSALVRAVTVASFRVGHPTTGFRHFPIRRNETTGEHVQIYARLYPTPRFQWLRLRHCFQLALLNDLS